MTKYAAGLDLNYILPSELKRLHPDTETSLEELKQMANQPDGDCFCGLPIWKYGQSDMCFTCTTGEADASEDYELLEEE